MAHGRHDRCRRRRGRRRRRWLRRRDRRLVRFAPGRGGAAVAAAWWWFRCCSSGGWTEEVHQLPLLGRTLAIGDPIRLPRCSTGWSRRGLPSIVRALALPARQTVGARPGGRPAFAERVASSGRPGARALNGAAAAPGAMLRPFRRARVRVSDRIVARLGGAGTIGRPRTSVRGLISIDR